MEGRADAGLAARRRARPARREPAFSFRAINYLVRLLTAHDAAWDAYFLGLGAEPLKVTYEELAAAPEPVVRRVLDHVGIDSTGDCASTPRRSPSRPTSSPKPGSSTVHDHLAALEA